MFGNRVKFEENVKLFGTRKGKLLTQVNTRSLNEMGQVLGRCDGVLIVKRASVQIRAEGVVSRDTSTT